MSLQAMWINCCILTLITLVWFFSTVFLHVIFQRVRSICWKVALRALMWVLFSVNQGVLIQITPPKKELHCESVCERKGYLCSKMSLGIRHKHCQVPSLVWISAFHLWNWMLLESPNVTRTPSDSKINIRLITFPFTDVFATLTQGKEAE